MLAAFFRNRKAAAAGDGNRRKEEGMNDPASTPDSLSLQLARIAHEAGAVIMPFFGRASARSKADNSPVTEADEAAEAHILKALAKEWPELPVVAEELAAAGRLPVIGRRFFLVDPLDGTREFISGRGEFTVNIALVEDGVPACGAVYAPAAGRMFIGRRGHGAWHARIASDETLHSAAFRPVTDLAATARKDTSSRSGTAGLRAVASRSHRSPETDAWLAARGISEVVPAGSSLKLCVLATGEADVYPRLGSTMEWDIAAGQAVLEAAGGQVLEAETGRPLRYGKAEAGFANPPFIAWAPGVNPF
jgi:3'(2'), 5'-bisphosphate nucleotidase